MMYLFAFFFLHDMCNRIPSLLRRHGAAFACGFIRVSGLFLVSMLVIIEIYFIFTIWSLCEDLKAGGEGAGLPALLCRGRQASRNGGTCSPTGITCMAQTTKQMASRQATVASEPWGRVLAAAPPGFLAAATMRPPSRHRRGSELLAALSRLSSQPPPAPGALDAAG